MGFKEDFPLLNKITYLDNAASILKPKSVVEAMDDFYYNFPMNPHSGDTPLGIKAVQAVANTRSKVAKLLSCNEDEVIFTSGTTDSLNKVAYMLEPLFKAGDEILLSYTNHNSNIIPFVEMAKRTGAKIVISENVLEAINEHTKLISLPQKENSIMLHTDLNKVYEIAKARNIILINDAAQAITTEKVSLDNADVVVFSSNKLFGPTGSGVLAVRKELLNKLRPTTFGGGATAFLKMDTTYGVKESIERFEAGTPNTAGIIGMGAGIDYFNAHTEDLKSLKELAKYAHDQLSTNKDITIHSQRGDEIIIFNVGNVPSQDVVDALSRKNIYLRSGVFCASLNRADQNGSVRCSLAIYNTREDIDKMVNAIREGGFFDFL